MNISYTISNLRDRFRMWVMWELTGWPFRRRCPQCAGEGRYSTEVMARYGDTPHTCDMCQGTGKVRR